MAEKKYLKVGLIAAAIILVIAGLALLLAGILTKEVYSLEFRISFFEPDIISPDFNHYRLIVEEDLVFNISVSGTIGSKNEINNLWVNQIYEISEKIELKEADLGAWAWAINWDEFNPIVGIDEADNFINFFLKAENPAEVLSGIEPIIDFTSQIVELVFGVVIIIVSIIMGFMSIKLK